MALHLDPDGLAVLPITGHQMTPPTFTRQPQSYARRQPNRRQPMPQISAQQQPFVAVGPATVLNSPPFLTKEAPPARFCYSKLRAPPPGFFFAIIETGRMIHVPLPSGYPSDWGAKIGVMVLETIPGPTSLLTAPATPTSPGGPSLSKINDPNLVLQNYCPPRQMPPTGSLPVQPMPATLREALQEAIQKEDCPIQERASLKRPFPAVSGTPTAKRPSYKEPRKASKRASPANSSATAAPRMSIDCITIDD